jgi:hypothetical protein
MVLLKDHRGLEQNSDETGGASRHSLVLLDTAATLDVDDDPAMLEFLHLVDALRYSITVSKPDFPGFLELPRELRDMIYDHYFEGSMLHRYDRRVLPILNSVRWEQIFFTSQQVRCEAFEVYLRKATSIGILSVGRAEQFMRILGSFPTSRPFELVHEVRLPFIFGLERYVQKVIKKKGKVPPSPKSYVQLLLRLPNLRRLEMTFYAFDVNTVPPQSHRRVPKNLSDFIDTHDFRFLLGCEKLEELFLDGIVEGEHEPGRIYSLDHDVSMQTLRDFGLWVKTCFRRRVKRGVGRSRYGLDIVRRCA